MFRQLYIFASTNEASKRTKINNVRKVIPHYCVCGVCFSYYLVFIITLSNMEYVNTM